MDKRNSARWQDVETYLADLADLAIVPCSSFKVIV
jgi:hypothetical protein